MAKDGTQRGGRRVRAGAKPDALKDKIEAGKTASRLLEPADVEPFGRDGCGVLVDDLLGTSRIADEVRCAGRTDEPGSKELADYLIYAFGVARRLDELGIPVYA